MPFREFLATLQSSMTDLHAALVDVNIAQLSDDLLELNLVELDKEVRSLSFIILKKYCCTLSARKISWKCPDQYHDL